MLTRWSFVAIDWIRFHELKPILHIAWETGDFSNLGIDGADDILADFDENTDPAEICNTLILELCGEGEPLHIDAGLPEMIHGLRKTRSSEDAADHLGALITSEPNVDDWWRIPDGLAGILSPDQVDQAYSCLAPANRSSHAKTARGIASFSRRFTPGDPAAGRLPEMIDKLKEASDQNLGLGVIRET